MKKQRLNLKTRRFLSWILPIIANFSAQKGQVKTCPFCGSDHVEISLFRAERYRGHTKAETPRYWALHCDTCAACGPIMQERAGEDQQQARARAGAAWDSRVWDSVDVGRHDHILEQLANAHGAVISGAMSPQAALCMIFDLYEQEQARAEFRQHPLALYEPKPGEGHFSPVDAAVHQADTLAARAPAEAPSAPQELPAPQLDNIPNMWHEAVPGLLANAANWGNLGGSAPQDWSAEEIKERTA